METKNDFFLLKDPIHKGESDSLNLCSENEDGDNDHIFNLESTEPNTMGNKKKSSYKKKRIYFLFKRYLISFINDNVMKFNKDIKFKKIEYRCVNDQIIKQFMESNYEEFLNQNISKHYTRYKKDTNKKNLKEIKKKLLKEFLKIKLYKIYKFCFLIEKDQIPLQNLIDSENKNENKNLDFLINNNNFYKLIEKKNFNYKEELKKYAKDDFLRNLKLNN